MGEISAAKLSGRTPKTREGAVELYDRSGYGTTTTTNNNDNDNNKTIMIIVMIIVIIIIIIIIIISIIISITINGDFPIINFLHGGNLRRQARKRGHQIPALRMGWAVIIRLVLIGISLIHINRNIHNIRYIGSSSGLPVRRSREHGRAWEISPAIDNSKSNSHVKQ